MQTAVVVLVIAVIVLAALAIWFWNEARRSRDLREHFGPEYEQQVQRFGDRGKAEHELEQRKDRIDKLHIRPLTADERTRFADSWRATQAHFVDDPAAAIDEADRLVGDAMAARGYPVGEFEQRAADVSVDHPTVVSDYRAAHDVALRQRRGDVSTDDQREALLHYRSLFDELLGTETTSQLAPAEVKR